MESSGQVADMCGGRTFGVEPGGPFDFPPMFFEGLLKAVDVSLDKRVGLALRVVGACRRLRNLDDGHSVMIPFTGNPDRPS